MNTQFRFMTDTATLAIFDPERLAHRAEADSDWWCDDLQQLDEVRSGSIALAGLGGDGVYRVRVTHGDLTPDERDYAADVVRGLGVEVVSGRLFFGPAECLPGAGVGFRSAEDRRGLLVPVENGSYAVDLFGIAWADSPRWWSDEPTVPDDAPADIVAVVRPRVAAFAAPESEPRLEFDSDTFLFNSTTRRVGPEPGMLLTTKVRRGPSDALCLKECGPLFYRASLVDTSAVAWKDTIRLRVLRVDHEAKHLVGEFVEKVDGR